MTPVKMNQNIEIYVFQSHLDTAMTVHFIEEIKAVGYIFTAIGLVTCIVGLVVVNVYFKDGIELAKISVAHPMFYAELSFSIMFFIAAIKAASAFSEIFKIALTGIPLEKKHGFGRSISTGVKRNDESSLIKTEKLTIYKKRI